MKPNEIRRIVDILFYKVGEVESAAFERHREQQRNNLNLRDERINALVTKWADKGLAEIGTLTYKYGKYEYKLKPKYEKEIDKLKEELAPDVVFDKTPYSTLRTEIQNLELKLLLLDKTGAAELVDQISQAIAKL